MSADWKPGDLAVCVNRKSFRCPHNCEFTGAKIPTSSAALRVTSVRLAVMETGRMAGMSCGCLELGFDGGVHGHASRFRKIVPDEPKACEEEFRILLQLSKKRVSA